jgi:hypothetical protein
MNSKEELTIILSKLRKDLEKDASWENDKACFKGQCAVVADIVTEVLKDNNYNAKTIYGQYKSQHGWTFHMFTTVEDFIIDLAADQFHPGDEEKFSVVVTPINDSNYKLNNMQHIKMYEQFIEEAILLPGQDKIKRSDAIDVAKIIIEGLGFEFVHPDTVTTKYAFVQKVGIPVGSIRRKKPEVGDIDIVITAPIDMGILRKQPWATTVSGGEKQVNFIYESPTVKRKVNLFSFTDPASFGAALLHTTGSHQYNIRLRNVVFNRGFGKLNQHGLFDKNMKFVAGPTEASIQNAMRVTVREANQREK